MSSAKRRSKREASERKRLLREEQNHRDIIERVLTLFPSFPKGELNEFAKRARWRGAALRWERNRDELTIRRAVEAHVRHKHTDYDERVRAYRYRTQARAEVKPAVNEILQLWQTPTITDDV